MTKHWHRLPREAVELSDVEIFKTQLQPQPTAICPGCTELSWGWAQWSLPTSSALQPWIQLPEGTLTVSTSGQSIVCMHFTSWVSQSHCHPSLPQEGRKEQEKKEKISNTAKKHYRERSEVAAVKIRAYEWLLKMSLFSAATLAEI